MKKTRLKPILCSREQLYQWYVIEKRSYRWLMLKLRRNNARAIKRTLDEYKIPIRQGSEAVATQWINADKRKQTLKDNCNRWLDPYRKMPRSEEAKKNLSLAKIGNKNPMWGVKGPENRNWLGGKRSWRFGRAISKEKKKQIIKTLGGKCVKCGTKENLTINHKIPWRVCRHHELWNLEPLCKKCHFSGPLHLR